MKISINNAGSIAEAKIELEHGKLNLRLGSNGLGKTTIGKAVYFKLNDPEKLIELKKYGSDTEPEVIIPETLKSCMIFDKQYIDTYLYKKDLINNTYELIIKTDNYELKKNEIESRLSKIQELVQKDEVQLFANSVDIFINDIGFKTNDEIDVRKKFGKGFKNGNFDQQIKGAAIPYHRYILSDKVVNWSKWFKDAESVTIDKNECPYCLSNLHDDFAQKRTEIIATFDNAIIKDNISSKEILAKFLDYSSKSLKVELAEITSLTSQVPSDKAKMMKQHLDKLKIEKQKLTSLKFLNPVKLIENLRDRTLKEHLDSLKLDIEIFSDFDSNLVEVLSQINQKINQTLEIIDEITSDLGILNSEMSKNIMKASSYVNDFLKVSGIPYFIDVLPGSDGEFRTVLKPNECKSIEVKSSNLSFGEFNAVSLILFSIDVVSRKPDLIILDDPVSSFDSNKKFAIIHHLFKKSGRENLNGKTVLLLTHDLIPVIDMVYNGKPSRDICNAAYLSCVDDIITEVEITKKSVDSILRVEECNAKNVDLNIISRLVHIRRFIELKELQSTPAYHIISSFLKHKELPKWKIDDSNYRDLTPNELKEGIEFINKFIPNFDYVVFKNEYSCNEKIVDLYKKAGQHSKIHLTRYYAEKNIIDEHDKVLWKFIDESYHIENDYLYVLDPYDFNQIPNYIIGICDKLIKI